MTEKLQILLATFNSERYLAQQLDSILAQDYQDFELLVRDGGSTDATMELISAYQQKFPGKIIFVGQKRTNARESFSELLKVFDADLLMFSDHDDVWMPDKISVSIAKYEEMKQRYGAETPIMVFSDAVVVDREMKVIAPSLIEYQNLNPRDLSLSRLILQNVPSGNEMLFNRALADLALPIPEEAVMHDHWISLVAASFGKIQLIERPTLYYRQHGDNVYGASAYSPAFFYRRMKQGRNKIRERFEQNITQAAVFGQKYGGSLNAHDRELCTALAQWPRMGFWEKRRTLWKYHVRKSGFLRNLGVFLIA